MLIKRKDPFTGNLNTLEINVTQEQLDKWKAGAYIQDVMPTLTPSEREFIMTGIWDTSWTQYVTNLETPPEKDKIKDFVDNVMAKSSNLDPVDDLERVIHERNRSKLNSILNPKRG